jgi:hypothetical protein
MKGHGAQPVEGLPDIDDSWKISRQHLKIREEIGKGSLRFLFQCNFSKVLLVPFTKPTSLGLMLL